jgi:hypothetical protein
MLRNCLTLIREMFIMLVLKQFKEKGVYNADEATWEFVYELQIKKIVTDGEGFVDIYKLTERNRLKAATATEYHMGWLVLSGFFNKSPKTIKKRLKQMADELSTPLAKDKSYVVDQLSCKIPYNSLYINEAPTTIHIGDNSAVKEMLSSFIQLGAYYSGSEIVITFDGDTYNHLGPNQLCTKEFDDVLSEKDSETLRQKWQDICEKYGCSLTTDDGGDILVTKVPKGYCMSEQDFCVREGKLV